MSDTVEVNVESASPGIRTYRKRRRMTDARRASMADNARFLVEVDGAGDIDLDQIFGRTAPRALDIGFGLGESSLTLAASDPGLDVLAIEVHTPGVAGLLNDLSVAGTDNVRVVEGDVVPLLERLPTGSFKLIQVLFPDPWPKTRHHRRRLVRESFVSRVADLLWAGGVLHVATDSPSYATAAGRAIAAEPRLGAVTTERPHRPVTRFEARANLAGRKVYELTAVRH